MVKKLIILTYFFLECFIVIAQSDSLKIDSLKKVLATQKEDTNKVNTLNKLSEHLTPLSNDSCALQYAKEALLIAGKLHYKNGQAAAYTNISTAYYYQSNYPGSIQNNLQAIKLWKELNDKRKTAMAYFAIQSAYGMQGNYSQNLENTYKALKLFEEIDDKEFIGYCYSELGLIYFSHDNPKQGFSNVVKGLNIFKAIKHKTGIARCYSLLGGNYMQQKNNEEALKYVFAALNMYKDLKENRNIYSCYNDLGYIYESKGDSAFDKGNTTIALNQYELAKKNFLISLDGYTSIGYKDFMAASCVDLGDLFIKTKNYSEAYKYFDTSLHFSLLVGFKDAIRNSYEGLYRLDSIKGDYQQAFKNHQQYILYRDSILNQESLGKSVQLQMQYEFDKKQAVAKAEQDEKDEENKRIKNQQYFAIASLGIVVLAVVIIALIQFRNNKHKQTANLLLQQEKERVEEALSELKSTQQQLIQSEKMASLGELTAGIAHEIQNPLNFVNNFSEVNNELIEELKSQKSKLKSEEQDELLDDIFQNNEKINHHGKRADAIVKGMLQHSRKNEGKKEPTDINALCDEYVRLSYHGLRAKDKNFNAEIKTEFDHHIGNINIVPQEMGRVMLNLINNAFYAVNEKKNQQGEGFQPLVTVGTKKETGKIYISVKDNGNGIPQQIAGKIFQPFFTTKPTGEGTGLGLSLSYDIAKAHGGEIKVETKEGKGSVFTVVLPV